MIIITLQDIAGIVIFSVVVAAWSVVYVSDKIRQARCKHDGGVNETQACDAICRKCGKNLGFIGSVKGKQ